MSRHEQFSYNEEYDHTMPKDSSRDAPEYFISSDSEDDTRSSKPKYFDLSSTSESEDDGEQNYFERFTKPDEFLECNRNDDEDDYIIPLETEDCDFANVELDAHGQMSCPICSIVFKSKIRFVIHRRRHFALDHFVCPVCERGFTKLEQCQAHEYKEHKETQDDENAGLNCPRYYFRTRNARKSINYDDEFHIDEEDLVSIAPSTCLYPYDGPLISDVYQAYQIEVKYGRNERKSHSRIQSKYAIECQKRTKAFMERKLAMVHARQEKQKRREQERQRRTLQDKQIRSGSPTSDSGDITKINRKGIAHLASIPRRHPLTPKDGSSGPKCYFCSLCGFTSDDKDGIQEHQQDMHPDVPVSELIHFLCINKSLKQKEPTNGDESRLKMKLRLREKQTPAQIVRAKRLEKKQKQKEAKLFKYRRHIPRLWEKETGTPSMDEFAFAIGLIRKVDVFLGPRGTNHSVVTSGLLRSMKRDVFPVPGQNKSVRIPMKRMPPADNSRFFCCQHCEFYGSTESEVRAHRRSEHLKSLRQQRKESKDNNSSVTEDSRVERLKRRRNLIETTGKPFAAEVHVSLDDISLSMGLVSKSVNRTEVVAQPPSKKFKVS